MPQQIVFFGSSPFSVIVLEKLLDARRYTLTAVITTPDKPVGRHLKLTPNPVKVLAQKNNIPVYDSITPLPPLPAKLSHLRGGGPQDEGDIGLVAAYGQIIKQEVLDKFNGQIYNIHPSLLPKYRGSSPLQQQILDGITETGITIIQLDALMDHGPIVGVAHDKISPGDTTETLGNRLFEKGADLFIKLLNNSPFPFPSLSQREGPEVSYTKKLTRQDGFVPWEEFQPEKLDRQFRAFYNWPGIWTLTPEGQRLKLVALKPKILVQLEGKTPQNWPIVV